MKTSKDASEVPQLLTEEARKNATDREAASDRRRSRSIDGQLRFAIANAGWRLLDVEKILDCSPLAETFPGSRGHAHHRHHVWDVLYARVA